VQIFDKRTRLCYNQAVLNNPSPNDRPPFSPEFSGSDYSHPEFEMVGSVFHIGDRSLSYDIKVGGGRRLFLWQSDEEDFSLAETAGWQRLLLPNQNSNGYACLEIPEGTRSAQSVLSGLEAWTGEKLRVINFISDYRKAVESVTNGKVDVSVSLTTTAKTKSGEFFITPPHNLTDDTELMKAWSDRLTKELESVLLPEDDKETLLAQLKT
jgi:hypothetical protein